MPASSDPVAWAGLEPAPGRLLVAAPVLTEETFTRTVIYLLEHDSSGTVGVILNRPSHTPVGQVLPDWQDAVSEPGVIYGGGPVQPDGALCLGLAAQAVQTEASQPALISDDGTLRPLTDGVCTVNLDGDAELLAAMTTRLRVFAGHSGWSGGQLDGELDQGAWFVVQGSPADVFSQSPTSLWRRVLRRQPPPLVYLSTYPQDVAAN